MFFGDRPLFAAGAASRQKAADVMRRKTPTNQGRRSAAPGAAAKPHEGANPSGLAISLRNPAEDVVVEDFGRNFTDNRPKAFGRPQQATPDTATPASSARPGSSVGSRPSAGSG